MSNYYAPCFYRIDFVVIPSYIELPCLHTSFIFRRLISLWMVLVTRFSPGRPKFTDRRIKGVRV